MLFVVLIIHVGLAFFLMFTGIPGAGWDGFTELMPVLILGCGLC
jgi:hypothetical protein